MKRQFGILGITLIALPSALFAQQSADSVTLLDSVVVTATRLTTSRRSVPATVSVLNGERLRAQGIRTVSDALRMVPGLNVVETGSFGGITSVFVRGGESDYMKVLIDGVPVNAPGGTFDFANLTLDNVERVEVVRGGASVLYGSDATTGVIQIFTKIGNGAPRWNVGVRGGTYSSVVVDGDVSGGSETMQYGFGFSRSTTDGLYDFNNDYDNLVLSGTVLARPDDRTEARLTARVTDSEYHFPTDFAGTPVDRNQFSVQDRVVGALEVSRFITYRIEGQVLLVLNEADGGLDDQSDDPADTLGFFAFSSVQTVQRRSIDARTNVYFTPGIVGTAGFHLEDQNERSLNESRSEFGNSSGSFDADRSNRGYYAQLQAEPIAGAAINGGVRLDDNDAFGTFFTWRVGGSYWFASNTRVRVSGGKAFKEPSFFENFADLAFVVGNPDLEPERSTMWEVAAEQELANGRVVLSAAYFNQHFRNLIQFNGAPANFGDPNYVNVAAANASGVELEAQAGPIGGFTVSTSYTYLDTEVKDSGLDADPCGFMQGEQLLRRPTHNFSFNPQYRLFGRGSVALNIQHVGNRDDCNFAEFPAERLELPSYTRVGLGAEMTIVPRRGSAPAVTLTGRVENLFDESYQEVFGFPARGRVVFVGGRVGM